MTKLAFWAAISDDQEIIVAYSADDGNDGEAARTECNQYINDALLNDRDVLRLVPLYTDPPAERVRVPDGWSISRSKVCDGYCIDGAGTSTLIDRGNNLYAFIKDMLSAAPEADHG